MLNSAARFLAPTAARFPEKVAVEDEWGAFTWRELEEAVVRSASALLARGLEAGRPESFNVLLKEMQSLGLDIRTVKKTSEN